MGTAAASAVTAGQYVTPRIDYQLIPPNTDTRLNWEYFSGTVMFDLSSPDFPAFLTDGFYIATVTVECNTNIADGTWGARLNHSVFAPMVNGAATGDLDTFPAAGYEPMLEVTALGLFSAGDTLDVTVAHDAAANRSIGIISGVVAKLD